MYLVIPGEKLEESILVASIQKILLQFHSFAFIF